MHTPSDTDPDTTVDAQFSVRDNVRLERYSWGRLVARYPEWPALSKREKLHVLDSESPTATVSTHNVTKDGYHDRLVDAMDPNQTTTTLALSHVAIGDDGGSGTSSTGGLNNELARIPVTDTIDNGDSIDLVGFFDSSEANSGGDIDEGGAVTAASGGQFANQGTFTATAKNSSEVLTLTITLTMGDA